MSDLQEHHADLSDAVRTLFVRAHGKQPANISALAAALKQHQPNVSNKLSNKRMWSFDDFFALAKIYDMKPATLLVMIEEARRYRKKVEKKIAN